MIRELKFSSCVHARENTTKDRRFNIHGTAEGKECTDDFRQIPWIQDKR